MIPWQITSTSTNRKKETCYLVTQHSIVGRYLTQSIVHNMNCVLTRCQVSLSLTNKIKYSSKVLHSQSSDQSRALIKINKPIKLNRSYDWINRFNLCREIIWNDLTRWIEMWETQYLLTLITHLTTLRTRLTNPTTNEHCGATVGTYFN